MCEPAYKRRTPEETPLYQVFQQNLNSFFDMVEADPNRSPLPNHLKREVMDFMACGVLSEGFSRWKCCGCLQEKILGFSCKRRGFCPSCAGRRTAERTLNLMEFGLPEVPIRHWVISLPHTLRYLMARDDRILKDITKINISAIENLLRKKARKLGVKNGLTGAISFLQRAGSDLRLNLHFHIIGLDGVFSQNEDEVAFHDILDLTDHDVAWVVKRIAKKSIKLLVKNGHLEYDNVVPLFPDHDTLGALQQASVFNKIALGARAGQFVRYLGGFIKSGKAPIIKSPLCAVLDGFSVHAATRIEEDNLSGREDILSYVSRGPVSNKRISFDDDGNILYSLKNTFGSKTHALFSPMEFIERIISIIPPPRQNQVTYWGVLGTHHNLRATVVSMKNVPLTGTNSTENVEDQTTEDQVTATTKATKKPKANAHRRTWAELLKAVFKIDIEKCDCGGRLRLVSFINNQNIIRKILDHLGLSTDPPELAPSKNGEFSHFY